MARGLKNLISLAETATHVSMYFRTANTSDAQYILVEWNYSYDQNHDLGISRQFLCPEWSLAGVGPRERAYGTSKYKWTIEGGGKANEENQGFNSSEDRRLGALNRTQGHQQLPLPVQKRHKWKSSRKEEIRKNKV